jgi:YfiH family protein
MKHFTKHNHNGVVFRTAETISSPHAFSTRLGGVSAGHLASMNFSVRRGDSAENVRENWRRLGEAAGMDLSEVVYARQIHSRIVPIVSRADAQHPWLEPRFECDGFVTAEPGLPVAVFTADCIPVLLEDAAHGVVAAVHCGWRGSVQDILGAALAQMQSLGAVPEDVSAAIGPGIGACCFEVGPEVAEGVHALLGGETQGLIRPGAGNRVFVDLKAANARRLTQLGVKSERIAVSDACTMCDPEELWSHRVTNGKRGVMTAVIALL